MPTVFTIDLNNDGKYSHTEPQGDHPEQRRGQLVRYKNRLWRIQERKVVQLGGAQTQQLFLAPAMTWHD